MKSTVLHYIIDTFERFSGRTALVEGSRQVSFGFLYRLMQIIGSSIKERLKITSQPIAVFLPKGIDCIAAFTGILYSGNFYVPLDIKSPVERLKGIIRNLNPALVISSLRYVDVLTAAGINPSCIIDINSLQESNNINVNHICVIDTDPVYIIYTSGSTGAPKGVVIPHRGVIDYIAWAAECFNINENTVIGNQSPFYFDNSTLDIYLCLFTGATLVLIPENYFAFPARLMEYVISANINFIFWVPSVMINAANLRVLDNVKPTGLKKILFAGEVMPNRHLNYWRKCLPGAIYANLYGPTEITVDCSYYVVDREFKDDEPLPIGVPRSNCGVFIVADGNRHADVNETGEICVKGSCLALGYWNDSEKSSGVFVQNPLNTNYYERIYRTGDIGYINQLGEIIFTGRKDNQIKHSGFRIELGEIENAVLSLEVINNACVLYDKERQEIVVFYESCTETEDKDIRKKLLELLPKYMIPAKMYRLDNLPLNCNGKVDRFRLSSMLTEK